MNKQDIINLEGLNIIQSIENFNYRLDDWMKGDIDVLFIVGLSGSGKSTIGKELSDKTNVPMKSLDHYISAMLRIKFPGSTHEERRAILLKEGVQLLIKDNPPGRIIFEGVQVCWLNPEELKKHAVIVVGTSFSRSTWRSILRDFTKEHWEKYGHIAPHFHISWNLELFKPVSNMLDILKKENNYADSFSFTKW